MITIDADERNRKSNRRKERTSNSSTGLSLGTKGWGGYRVLCGIESCARPPSLTDARDASPTADDDAASEKAATLDDVTSPDIGVGGDHIDTDERAAPMRKLPEKLVENIKDLKTEKTAGISKSDEEALLITSNIGVGGEQMGTNRAASSMRVLSERLVGNYEIVATEKEAEKLPFNELQERPENLWRRLAEAEAALNAERVAHAETKQKLKELNVAKEDGVSTRDVSRSVRSPVIEVGGERDASINSSAAASMTEFREVKTTADDLRVELEVKSQLDKNVSRSPVIEVGGERDASINSSAAASMSEFKEGKLTADDLRVELEVKSQIDKNHPSLRWGEREIRALTAQLQPQ
jgi:hypothetical protein